mgnify:CR=1 FL=1
MKQKGSFGWGELAVGILLILLGVFTFVRPDSMLTGAVVIYGIIAIAMGVYDIVVYARLARFTGFGPTLSLITGIISVMCGTMLIADPNIGKWALTVLLPVWFIAHCIAELTRIGMLRPAGGAFYFLSLTLNILGLILGFAMLFSPALSFVTVRTVCCTAALCLILSGIESVTAAFTRRGTDR